MSRDDHEKSVQRFAFSHPRQSHLGYLQLAKLDQRTDQVRISIQPVVYNSLVEFYL